MAVSASPPLPPPSLFSSMCFGLLGPKISIGTSLKILNPSYFMSTCIKWPYLLASPSPSLFFLNVFGPKKIISPSSFMFKWLCLLAYPPPLFFSIGKYLKILNPLYFMVKWQCLLASHPHPKPYMFYVYK